MKARPAGLSSERFAEHFRAQARSSHSQQDKIAKSALLHFLRKAQQTVNIGQLLLYDVQPADPFVLVGPGPQRLVAGPKPANSPVLAPDLHLRVESGLHLRGARPDLQAGVIALE